MDRYLVPGEGQVIDSGIPECQVSFPFIRDGAAPVALRPKKVPASALTDARIFRAERIALAEVA